MKRISLSAISLIVAFWVLSGCLPFERSIAPVPIQKDSTNECERPTDVVLKQSDLDMKGIEIARNEMGKFTLGELNYKSHPEVVELLANASREILIVRYLVCDAIKQGFIDKNNSKQVNYMYTKFAIMQESLDKLIEWEKENPFPDENIKEKARLLLRNKHRVRQLEPEEFGPGLMKLSEVPNGVYLFTDTINIHSEKKIIFDRQPVRIKQLKINRNFQILVRSTEYNGIKGLTPNDVTVKMRCFGEITQTVKDYLWTEIGGGYYEVGINEIQDSDSEKPCILWVEGDRDLTGLIAMEPVKIEAPPIANNVLFEIHKLQDGAIYVVGFIEPDAAGQKAKENIPNTRWVILYSDQWEKASEIIAVRLSEIISVKPHRDVEIENRNLIAWDIQLR